MLLTVCLLTCLSQGVRAQTPAKEAYPKECVAKLVARGAWPKGAFDVQAYKHAPIVKFQIKPDGTVTNVTLVLSSGVRGIDNRAIAVIAKFKDTPRPTGCGTVDSEGPIIIDFW
jgi:TonB family protein